MFTGDQNVENFRKMDDSELIEVCNNSKQIQDLCEPIFKEKVLATVFATDPDTSWFEQYLETLRCTNAPWIQYMREHQGKKLSELSSEYKKLSNFEIARYYFRFVKIHNLMKQTGLKYYELSNKYNLYQ